MRVVCLLSLGWLCPFLMAQPQLTESVFSQLGGQVSMVEANPLEASPGDTGENAVWNFSDLEGLGGNDYLLSRIDPATTAQSAMFPNATIADLLSFSENDAVDYFQIGNNVLTFLGGVGGAIEITFDNPMDLLTFPASLGDSLQDTFAGNFNAEGALVAREGTTVTTVDASGTLILPGGNLEDVLRVYTREEFTDTVSGPNANVIETERDVYRYYPPNQASPALILIFTRQTANNNTVNLVSVNFQDLNAGTGNTSTETRWLPHITQPGGGFQTQLYFKNRSRDRDVAILRGYDAAGLLTEEIAVSLPADSSQSLAVADLFMGASPSHVGIAGCIDCGISTGYRADLASAATAHVHESGAVGLSLHLYAGDPALVFDGIALVNLGDLPATIIADRLDGDGLVVETATLVTDLPIRGKALAVLSSLLTLSADDLVRITSDQPIAVTSLRGTLGAEEPFFLFENRPVNFP